MSFALRKDEAIPKGVRRVVCNRVDKALERIKQQKRKVSDDAVHDVRKRFKEIRGTLRLIRTELGTNAFDRENRTFRDAGRPLSVVRDAKVLVGTLDQLVAHFDGRVKPEGLGTLKRCLQTRRRDARKQVLTKDRAFKEIARRVAAARKRVSRWPLKRKGWRAIEGGLQRAYEQGRRAMEDARADGSDDALHEWRKRTKDLRYELELLQPLWPETMQPLVDQAHHLTDLLGEDHDLCVLRQVVSEEAAGLGPRDDELLFALIDERRAALQREAKELGRKVFEEGGNAFVKRIRGYWKAWRNS